MYANLIRADFTGRLLTPILLLDVSSRKNGGIQYRVDMDLNNKQEVAQHIQNGMPCYYRYGFRWKGAGIRPISSAEALKLLPNYSPGIGFWELREETIKNCPALVFNEYSENDLL
jgi:hypothetical protein